MTPKKPRITTEATKAKLPKPKRKRPPRSAPKVAPRETWADGYAKWAAKAERAKRVQCPRCEKLVLAGPHDIHTCYDAKALREAGLTPSPIAGQPLDGVGSAPAPDFRAIPCGEDVKFTTTAQTWTNATWVLGRAHFPPAAVSQSPIIPPVTEPYPWPVRVLNWLDDAPAKARRTIAAWLRALAGKVEP